MENTQQKKLSPTILAMVEGQKRARARGVHFGIKKGTLTPRKLALRSVEREVQNKIAEKALTLIRAGMITALGQNFVYRIDEEIDLKGRVVSRKHILVTDADEIATALDQMEEGSTHPEDKYYYVTAKEPDHKAVEMLLNRAFGKPKETVGLEVEHKFSLRDLGKRADEIEKSRAKEIQVVEPVSLPTENIGSEVPPTSK